MANSHSTLTCLHPNFFIPRPWSLNLSSSLFHLKKWKSHSSSCSGQIFPELLSSFHTCSQSRSRSIHLSFQAISDLTTCPSPALSLVQGSVTSQRGHCRSPPFGVLASAFPPSVLFPQYNIQSEPLKYVWSCRSPVQSLQNKASSSWLAFLLLLWSCSLPFFSNFWIQPL